MSNHTEGPWTLVKKFAEPDHIYGMAEIHAATRFPLIELEICDEATRANANLFTAAPELLDALRYHHNWQLEHGQREGFGYINSKPYLDSVTAIAKAEGRDV